MILPCPLKPTLWNNLGGGDKPPTPWHRARCHVGLSSGAFRESLGLTTGSGPLEEGLSALSGQNRHRHHSSAWQSFSGIIQGSEEPARGGVFYTSPRLLEICLISDPSPNHDPWEGSG